MGRLFRVVVGEVAWVHWTAPSPEASALPFWPPVWVLLLSLGLSALIWAAVSLFSAYALQEAKQRPILG